jgi:hypothetical protein
MRNNLQLYHKILEQLCQWFPQERITRMKNLALMITGLYLGKSVQIPKIVRKWHVAGQLPSLTNRMRRYLDNGYVCVEKIYKPVAQMMLQRFSGQTIRLVIDCTKVGFNHRILAAGIAYKKRTLPLAWSVHKGSKGHVTAEEQVALLRQASFLLPKDCTIWLLGDAGFQSVALLRWLGRQNWHYVIRQSGNTRFYSQRMKHWYAINAVPLQSGETDFVGWVRLTENHNYGWVYLVLHWEKGEEEPWYLVSDKALGKQIIKLYKIRMWIEEMYGDMKGHGFDLESTHLRDSERISRLFLGVCLAFVWLISVGSRVVKNGLRCQVDRKDRRDKSYFRIGLDWIENCLRLGRPIWLHFTPVL